MRCTGEDVGASVCVDGQSPGVHDASSLAVLPRHVTLSTLSDQLVPGEPPQFSLFNISTEFAHAANAPWSRLSTECEGRTSEANSVIPDSGLCVSVMFDEREFALLANPFLPGRFSGSGSASPTTALSVRLRVFSPSRLLFSTLVQGVLPPTFVGPIVPIAPPLPGERVGERRLAVLPPEGVTIRWVPKPTGKIQIQLRSYSVVGDEREAVCVVPQARGEYFIPQDVWDFFQDQQRVEVNFSAVEQRVEQTVIVESQNYPLRVFSLVRN